MEPRSLRFIAEASGGVLAQGDPQKMVARVCTDSRAVQADDLFIAIAGERFDGHSFVNEAAIKSVAAVMIERSKAPVPFPPCAVVLVDDARVAFGLLAARYRADFNLPVVAVAGSNGKTTTKELLGSLLSQRGPAVWSEASFNNDIGVPHTLLRLDRSHWVLAQEIGTNHHGELAPLVRLAQPSLGVITSIGREHLEFFCDVAGVAQEEGWLAELLPRDGKLFLNGDSEWTGVIAKRCHAVVVRAGLNEGNDWRATNLRMDERGVTFDASTPRAELNGEYRVNLLGRHQVMNALLALAVGAELGLTRDELIRGLAAGAPAKMRLQIWEAHGVRVIDDSYNANADSTLAALQVLRDLTCEGRRVAVLGDMAELGAHTHAAHEEVGRRAAELSIDELIAVGSQAATTARAARAAGLLAVRECAHASAAGEALMEITKRGDLVLLKASRAARLERAGEMLRNR
ncbi:MAG: UDP-N-acetylmuramoyl-tripeptide--D-alanyl-D-alanine ligase [Pedosphaera sp.]|nr:UDP-N-acetylmuramoyl-tripeptide--D-alanyl-D-alanine ligase [Pedosphaera sp.]MST01377.1 UDP-N-acetylmuramoyl-tripeptide--D-alanyl-D-alanine ligase [Pedosphaera sp.]